VPLTSASSTATSAPAPRRGRPPRVTPQAILDAVDAKDGSDWTMASIAAELGVSEPAIYYHFASKQSLLTALGTRVIGEFQLPPRSPDWEQWLTDVALALLDCCRQHPFLLDIDMATAATNQPGSIGLMEELLGQLVSCGFTVEGAATACEMVMLVVQAVALAPESDDAQLLREQDRLLGLAAEADAQLAAQAYAMPAWGADGHLRRLLPVALAGIKAQLAPAPRRRGRS
jgi:AcrR family transcriptional regulator